MDTIQSAVALVLDDARYALEVARTTLERVRGALGAGQRMDLLLNEPAGLVTLLHLDGAAAETRERVRRMALAGGFRILELDGLPAEVSERFVQNSLERAAVRELDARHLESFFAQVAAYLSSGGMKSPASSEGGAVKLRFRNEGEFLTMHATGRLFVPSTREPEVGSTLTLALTVGRRQGPVELTARVVQVGGSEHKTPGFEVELAPPPDEVARFESFLVATQRGTPWPERSGRCHDRFPLSLVVEYQYAGATQRARSVDISRGGMFIATAESPPEGTTLELRLLPASGGAPVRLSGEVVHAVSPADAQASGEPAGAGVRFTETASVVQARIEELLGQAAGPAQRRALVADDDRFFRTIVGNLLRGGGYEILEAADGSTAFQKVMDELLRLDLLVVDLHMPGMGGVELVDRIRRVGGEEELSLVVLTGATLEEKDQQLIAMLGADDVISKSEPPERILERIDTAVRRRQERLSA